MGSNFEAGDQIGISPGFLWYCCYDRGQKLAASVRSTTKEVIELDDWQLKLLQLCNGTATIAEISATLDSPQNKVLAQLSAWEESAPGSIIATAGHERFERHTEAAIDLFRCFDAERAGDVGQRLSDYHQHGIVQAIETFDARETTVSHLYRKSHPALGNRSYGAAFADALFRELAGTFAGDHGLRVLEVGGGAGFFANELLARFRETYPQAYRESSYHIVDLSPELQRSQAEICAEHARIIRLETADILAAELEAGYYDVIVANEMIADLPVALVDIERQQVCQGEADLVRLDSDYQLQPLLEGLLSASSPRRKCYLNVGAIRFVEKIVRLLRRGGVAVITEYGTLDGIPAPVPLPKHREFSIQFAVLQRVAERLRLTATLCVLGDWLGFDADYRIVHEQSLNCLRRRLLPFINGPRLESWAYDEKMLRAALGDSYRCFGNITTTAVSNRWVLSPFRFYAMVLRAADASDAVAASGRNTRA